MKSYPVEHWQALGEWVSVARHQAGYSDTKKWAEVVGRSTRMVLGLERGELVGAKTIEAVSEALGVANWSLFHILESGKNETPTWSDAQVAAARERYERETGLEADSGGSSNMLELYSDGELLAELGRRLATRPLSRTERRMREVTEHRFEDGLSEPTDTPDLAVAAHEEEGSIAGEQEESDTP